MRKRMFERHKREERYKPDECPLKKVGGTFDNTPLAHRDMEQRDSDARGDDTKKSKQKYVTNEFAYMLFFLFNDAVARSDTIGNKKHCLCAHAEHHTKLLYQIKEQADQINRKGHTKIVAQKFTHKDDYGKVTFGRTIERK